MNILILFVVIFLIINLIFIWAGIRMVKQNEKLSDIIKGYDKIQDNTISHLEGMLAEMKEIDLRGSFESDDEVGVVFNELKDIIERYKQMI